MFQRKYHSNEMFYTQIYLPVVVMLALGVMLIFWGTVTVDLAVPEEIDWELEELRRRAAIVGVDFWIEREAGGVLWTTGAAGIDCIKIWKTYLTDVLIYIPLARAESILRKYCNTAPNLYA